METTSKCHCCDDAILLERVKEMMAQTVANGWGEIFLPVECMVRIVRTTKATSGTWNGTPVNFRVIDWTPEMCDYFVQIEAMGLKFGSPEFRRKAVELHPWLNECIWISDVPAMDAARARARELRH